MCALAAKAAPLCGSSRDPRARLRRAYRTTIDRSLARVAVVVENVCCLITSPERNLHARQSCRTQQAQSRRTQATLQPPATARTGKCRGRSQALPRQLAKQRSMEAHAASMEAALTELMSPGTPLPRQRVLLAQITAERARLAAWASYLGALGVNEPARCAPPPPRLFLRMRLRLTPAPGLCLYLRLAPAPSLRLTLTPLFRRSSTSRLHPSSAGLIWHRWPC